MAVDATATTISATSVASLAITLPTGYHVGQRAFIGLALDNGTGGTYTVPAGWKQLGAELINTTDGSAVTYWWKNITGAETATQTISWTGSTADCAAWSALASGVNLSVPPVITSTINNTANASPVAISGTSITVASGDTLIVSQSMDNSSGGNSTYSFSTITGLANLATANDGTFSTINVQGASVTGGPSTTVATTATLTLGSGNSGWIQAIIRSPGAAGGQPRFRAGWPFKRSPQYFPVNRDTNYITVNGNVGVISGLAISTSTAFGSVIGTGVISGLAVSTSTANGSVTGLGQISGISVSTSTALGNVGGAGQISGIAVSTSVANGLVVGSGAISGVAVSTSTANGLVVGTGVISGLSVGTSTAFGFVADAGSVGVISGMAISTSTALGSIVGVGQISGLAVGSTTVTGNIGANGQISGMSVSTSVANGSVTAFNPGVVGQSLMVGFICNVGTLDDPDPRL